MKGRAAVGGTASAISHDRGVVDGMLMGHQKNLRSSGVDQITKLQDEMAAVPNQSNTRNNTQVISKQTSLENYKTSEGNKMDGRSIRMQSKLPAYQHESFQSRVHGLGYQQINGFSSSKKDIDDVFMLKRRTQNVYSNDNIGKKGSVVSLQKGYDAFNSFEGLK